MTSLQARCWPGAPSLQPLSEDWLSYSDDFFVMYLLRYIQINFCEYHILNYKNLTIKKKESHYLMETLWKMNDNK